MERLIKTDVSNWSNSTGLKGGVEDGQDRAYRR